MMLWLGARSHNIQEQQQLSKIDQNAERLALTPEMTPEGRAILKQLRARVAITFAESQSNQGQAYAAQAAELDRKIRMTPLWVASSKAIQAIRQPVPELLAVVDELKRFLLSENASKDELDQRESQSNKLRADIDAKILAALNDAIGLLRKQIGVYLQLAPAAPDSEERMKDLPSLINGGGSGIQEA
jgi:hypothetical protein